MTQPAPPTPLAVALLLALGACNDPTEPPPIDGTAVFENGVLTVRGDAGPNDIRVGYSAAGVVVVLDNVTTPFDEAIGSIDIDAGAGDDAITFEQSVVADLALSIASGQGDDDLLLSFAPAGDGTVMTLPAVVETGPGSDVLDFRWDGTAVPALNTYLTLTTNGTSLLPEEVDEVLVAFEHGDPARPVIIGGLWNGNAPADAPPGGGTGGGDPRSLDLELDFTEGHADVTLLVAGGVGPDELQLDVDYSGVTLQQGRVVLDSDLNEGDNHAGKYVITSATHTFVDTRVTAGAGNDVVDLEHVLGGDGEHTYVVELGDGDNQATIGFGDGARGARPSTGTRNVTATYRTGVGQSSVDVDAEVVEPLTSELTVDHGAAQAATTTGRYKLQLPWDREAAAGASVVPSQMKVIVLSPSGSALDFRVDVGDPDVDLPGAFGVVSLQGAAVQQTDLDFLHQRASPVGAAEAEEEWTLRLRDALVTGDASLVVDVPPELDRLVYLQDTLEVAAGATLKVALNGDAPGDNVLANLLGVTAAGRYELLADGAAGNDLLAVLSRDLVAEGAGTMAFEVMGGDGDDVLGLDAPEGLGRDATILHALDAGAGADACFTLADLPATACEIREPIGEDLLKLLETVFGVEPVEVWRK